MSNVLESLARVAAFTESETKSGISMSSVSGSSMVTED
tara:strand:- start:470 stop:583 length:114 start_codon:yes stop_codon:yes gene_type:complete